jgi:hypothetical protein
MSTNILRFPDLAPVGCPGCGKIRTTFRLPVPTAFILALANSPCPQCGGRGIKISGLNMVAGGLTTRLKEEGVA